ncbi:MAG: phosphatidylinositol mannoside acyltransferase [Actinobacteria bacterium]|nr:phosphatidylinositol mannoside acyltransferase [Actinomycetota bacterium]
MTARRDPRALTPVERPAPDETRAQRIAYRAYLLMERVAIGADERVGRAAFSLLGRAAHRLAPGVRATVSGNLAHVLGRPADSPLVRAATREAFDLYARYWFETFRARTFSEEEIRRRFHIEGLEHVDRAMEAGGGCIMALPHMGNWDVAGQFMAMSGYRLVSVAEELRPPRLARLFLRHRQALGMEILVLDDSKQIGLQLAQLLSENAALALVADRDLGGRGVEVEMFGAPRTVPAGPALLSLSTGAPLMPSSVHTVAGGWRCIIGAPLKIERSGSMRDDVTRMTRALAEEFERGIAANPVDWHMFQPAWPDVPGGPAGDGDRPGGRDAPLLNPE